MEKHSKVPHKVEFFLMMFPIFCKSTYENVLLWNCAV